MQEKNEPEYMPGSFWVYYTTKNNEEYESLKKSLEKQGFMIHREIKLINSIHVLYRIENKDEALQESDLESKLNQTDYVTKVERGPKVDIHSKDE